MKKKDIVKLVFAVLFVLAALFFCVMSVSVGQSVREGGEEVDGAGEAIGYVFVAIFGAVVAVIGTIITLVCNLISTVICIFGVRSPERPAKIVFWGLIAANAVIALVVSLATFVGL